VTATWADGKLVFCTGRTGPDTISLKTTNRGKAVPKTGRIEIRAEDQFLVSLEQLAQASGTSKADVIHRAVGLYAQALKEAEEGNVIQFVPENELVRFVPENELAQSAPSQALAHHQLHQ
jgi:hypothetical protein